MSIRLEVSEPARSVDIKVGMFTYLNSNQESVTADFYIHTVPFVEADSNSASLRQSDLNEQLTEQWTLLQAQGCSCIKYQDVLPNPIF